MFKINTFIKYNIALLLLFCLFLTGPTMADDRNADIPEGGKTTLKPEMIHLSAAGLRLSMDVYIDDDGIIFVPLKDTDTGRLMERFECRVSYLEPMKTIVLGFRGKKDFRMRLGQKKAEFGRETIELSKAPLLINGKPYIPFDALEKAWQVRRGYNEHGKIYYMDPIIKEVTLKFVKGRYVLTASPTGRVSYKTSVLQDPHRYVIDIEGAVLEEGIAGKDMGDRNTGSIFISQESYNPNRVRIEVPLGKGIEVEMAEHSVIPGKPETEENKHRVQAYLFLPVVIAPVQDLGEEKVYTVKIREKEDRVEFTIKTSGPVQYEWRRLLPPDNRYFIDIPKATYHKVFKKDFNVGYLKDITVTQLRPKPDPIVRIAFNLHVPSKVKVEPNPDKPNEILVTVFSETINPRFVQRQGFGVTEKTFRGGIVICIDPGHGGSDCGAVNRSMGLEEESLNLDISLRLAKLLRKAGWRVVMTRITDRDVSYAGSSDLRELSSRTNIANGIKAQIFVSIHINASTSSWMNGTSVYYYKSDSAGLASHVQNHLVRSIGLRDQGVKTDSFYVIRHTNMPAILVETAFISNPSDAAKLSSSSFRQKCAEGIYNGLMSYAKTKKMGTALKAPSPHNAIVKKKKKELEKRIEESKPVGNPDYGER